MATKEKATAKATEKVYTEEEAKAKIAELRAQNPKAFDAVETLEAIRESMKPQNLTAQQESYQKTEAILKSLGAAIPAEVTAALKDIASRIATSPEGVSTVRPSDAEAKEAFDKLLKYLTLSDIAHKSAGKEANIRLWDLKKKVIKNASLERIYDKSCNRRVQPTKAEATAEATEEKETEA